MASDTKFKASKKDVVLLLTLPKLSLDCGRIKTSGKRWEFIDGNS